MKPHFLRSLIEKKVYILAVAIPLLLMTALLLFEQNAGGSSIHSPLDALWYFVVTLSTVGYGDMTPVTTGGRIIGFILVLSSFGLLGYWIGNVTSNINEYMEKKKLGFLGTKMENHTVIIGWGDFGHMVADQIVKAGNELAVITNQKEQVDVIRSSFDGKNVFVLYTEYNILDNLKKANVAEASSVFLNFDDDTEALVYFINLRRQFPKPKYVVSVNNSALKQTFITAGVTFAVSKNEIASKLVASYIFEPDVAYITEDLMSTAINEFDYDILEYKVVEGNPFIGKSYLNVFVELKRDFNSVVIGISRCKDGHYQLLYNPKRSLKINIDDYMIIIANGLGKKKIEKAFKVGEGRF